MLRENTWLLLYSITACGMWLSEMMIVKFDIASGIESRSNFYAYNSITCFVAAVAFFCFFLKVNCESFEKCNVIICGISQSTFAVYLIHAHPCVLAKFWLGASRYFELNNIKGLLIISLIALLVFSVCICIDKIRIFCLNTVERILARK